MPVTFAEYFDQEMRHLSEAAAEFAEKHPERAAFLRLQSKDRDPYVERLLEGFAYLAARTRQKLDDEYPEFTHGLLGILLPHYLRPIPSMAVLQFLPRRGALQETQVIPRGTPVSSPPVGAEGVSCRFTTARDVRLHPIALEEARLERTAQGRQLLKLRFAVDRGVDPRHLALDPLTVYLHGEATLAGTLYLYLTRHASRVLLRPAGGEGRPVTPSSGPPVRPGGIAEEESLLPYTFHSFPGYRYLQEYFAFRERYLFVELHGITGHTFEASTKGFELEIHFDREYPEERRFTADAFRLGCTPIVNLFPLDAEPIRVDRETGEFHVLPDARYPTGIEVYTVESVIGANERGRRSYAPFHRFDPGAPSAGTFVAPQRLGETGRWHTFLRVNRPLDHPLEGDGEALSITALCTNGPLPHELAEGSIDVPGPEFPEYAHFTNLTRPTAPVYPPQGRELEWRLVAHLALNHSSIRSPAALRSLLELYDWAGAPATRRRISGVRTLQVEPCDAMIAGAPVRGSRIFLELDEEHFLDRSDAYLFGFVLSRFFELYAAINSFVQVNLKLVPSGDSYEWGPSRGQIPLI